jgi:hypothetical protein
MNNQSNPHVKAYKIEIDDSHKNDNHPTLVRTFHTLKGN